MIRLGRLVRALADQQKFADRWGTAPSDPGTSLPPIPQLPKYPVYLPSTFNPAKDHVFDLDLPQAFKPSFEPLQIWAMGDGMFSVNGVWVPGSLMVFRDLVLQWDVKHPEHIQDYHLDVLRYMRPKLEYVIIGTGKTGRTVLSQTALRRYQSIGLAIDSCPTVFAM